MELKDLYDQWKAMEPTTEWIGEPPWQKQITYNPAKAITTELFSAYLQEVGVEACSACNAEALVIPSEVHGFAMHYATPIESTIEPELSDVLRAMESGTTARAHQANSRHYATDCLNCGNRMFYRKEFVEKKIEEFVGQDSTDENK